MANTKIWETRLAEGLCKYCGERPFDVGSKVCHVCKRARYDKYRGRPYMSAESQRDYRREVRRKVMALYGDRCSICGESAWEFLTIDHINRDGSKERRAAFGPGKGSSHQFFMKLQREPKRDDLRILCMNCNWAIAQFGYSPKDPLR